MSIYKHLQTDGTGNWFLNLFARLFNLTCESYIAEWKNGPLHCVQYRWHKRKHYDESCGTHWCYGDEFFEG